MRRFLTALVLLGAITSCIAAQDRRAVETFAPDAAPAAMHPKAPKVPEYVVFAGDTVRFDRVDFRERLDRELLSYTYMHSTSTMVLKRAPRIFGMVEPILKRQGVHDDLKYLMAIESNLDPKALSRAGAAGLWQFMKSAAATYGLEVSQEVDERYNIEKETVAACRYLKDAHRRYGDWMTAAASYNAGIGNINKAISEQKQRSALDLWLTEETSRYMFRLLAAKMFFEHPEDFGFDIAADEKYPVFEPSQVVTVSDSIPSIVDFALEHGTTYAALRGANLWLIAPKLTNSSGKTYKILIP